MSSVAAVRRFLVARDQITVFCAIPVGLLGFTASVGWIVRLPVLMQILPGMSPMMFNTAVGGTRGQAAQCEHGIAAYLTKPIRPSQALRLPQNGDGSIPIVMIGSISPCPRRAIIVKSPAGRLSSERDS